MSTPKTLTVDEENLLLDTLRNKDGTQRQQRKGIRNHALALVMLDAGLRIAEATGLEVNDLWFQNSPVTSILVRPEIAKGNNERIVPVHTRLSEAITEMWLTYWVDNYKNVQSKAFTFGQFGKPLTTRQVRRIIVKSAIHSIGRSVNPHVLRHTFASKLMRVTSMRTVQELLGHKHLSSTEIYTHPNEQDKHKAIAKLNCTV